MPGAKWSELANQWGSVERLSIRFFFYVEAKECSLMNVGPETSDKISTEYLLCME